MFFPVTVDPNISASGANDTINAFRDSFVLKINATRRLYTAWRSTDVVSDCPSDRTSACCLSAARILVRTSASADGSLI
jgi:hypothetical protein